MPGRASSSMVLLPSEASPSQSIPCFLDFSLCSTIDKSSACACFHTTTQSYLHGSRSPRLFYPPSPRHSSSPHSFLPTQSALSKLFFCLSDSRILLPVLRLRFLLHTALVSLPNHSYPIFLIFSSHS